MPSLRLNRTDAAKLLLGARIAVGVGVGLAGIALLLPVAADPPEIPTPPAPTTAPATAERGRIINFDPADLGETFATLGPQRQSATQPRATESSDTEKPTPNTFQASASFNWRYLGRIQTSSQPWAVLDLGSGQRIVKQGETIDHPSFGPFTLTDIQENEITLAGVSEERTLDRAARQANALGSFTAPEPTTNAVPNRNQPFAAPRRTPEAIEEANENRMQRQRDELLRLREERLRQRQRESQNGGDA